MFLSEYFEKKMFQFFKPDLHQEWLWTLRSQLANTIRKVRKLTKHSLMKLAVFQNIAVIYVLYELTLLLFLDGNTVSYKA